MMATKLIFCFSQYLTEEGKGRFRNVPLGWLLKEGLTAVRLWAPQN